MLLKILVINALGLLALRPFFNRTATGRKFWEISSIAILLFYLVYFYMAIYPKTSMSIASGDFWHFYKDLFYFGWILTALFLIIGFIWWLRTRKKPVESTLSPKILYIILPFSYIGLVFTLAYVQGEFESHMYDNYRMAKNATEEEQVEEELTFTDYTNDSLGLSFRMPSNVEVEESSNTKLVLKVGKNDALNFFLDNEMDLERQKRILDATDYEIISSRTKLIDSIPFEVLYVKHDVKELPNLNRLNRYYFGNIDSTALYIRLLTKPNLDGYTKSKIAFDSILESLSFR